MNKVSEPGPLFIGLEGERLTERERSYLKNPAVGGVVLFTRNFNNTTQLKELNKEIRDEALAPMLICVDHEGGRVQRFKQGFSRLPPLALLGRMYSDTASTACDFAYRHARVMATELRVADVDISFAPVLDLDGESCVIGDRSFSPSPEAVAELAAHYLAGMHDAGMKTCGKHFPGHGSVYADSHTDEVVDRRSLQEIERSDMVPFKRLLPDLDSLMMAHVLYPEVDPHPAGYSPFWMKQLLRLDLGYEGVIFSDDLGMQAAVSAGTLADRLGRSLEAGCDAVLVCQPVDVKTLFGELEGKTLPPAPRLKHLAGALRMTNEELETVSEWRHWQQSVTELEQSQWA